MNLTQLQFLTLKVFVYQTKTHFVLVLTTVMCKMTRLVNIMQFDLTYYQLLNFLKLLDNFVMVGF